MISNNEHNMKGCVKVNLNKLDRIEMSMDDVLKIKNWHDFHYDALREKGEMNFPLQECVFAIREDFQKMADESSMDDVRKQLSGVVSNDNIEKIKDMRISYNEILIHFKITSETIEYNLFINSEDEKDSKPSLSWKLDDDFFNTHKFTWTSSFKTVSVPDEMAQRQAMYFTLVTMNTFEYMTNVTENVIEGKARRVVSKKAKGKSNNKKNRTVKISVNKYTFDHDDKEKSREYQRHTEGWMVRGHWRTYKKTGKRVWIPPHSKGNKDNVEEKTYKF